MTTNEKLEKIKKLADAMYNAAACLGPVGSGERLHKTMDDYHQFIIHEYYKEETVRDDLDKAAKHHLYSNILYDDVYVGNPTEEDCIEMFKAGAKWQREQMMEGAVDAVVDSMTVQRNTDSLFFKVVWLVGQRFCKVGEKVKLIITKRN